MVIEKYFVSMVIGKSIRFHGILGKYHGNEYKLGTACKLVFLKSIYQMEMMTAAGNSIKGSIF